VRTELLVADEILIEQADIDHHAQRHEAVAAALEFDEQVEVEPLLAGFDAPDDIIGAVAQVFADVVSLDGFEGGEVEFLQPGIVDETLDEVADDERVGEEEFVAGIVGCGHEGRC